MATISNDWLTGCSVAVYDLEQPRFFGMPIHDAHQPGYFYSLHRRHGDNYRPATLGPRTGAAGVIVCMEHTGTHIDAICHQADDLKLFGGVDAVTAATARGFTYGAVEEIDPIVAQGVLIDLAGERGVDRLPALEPVGLAEFQRCCAQREITIGRGDVVLVRTGYGAIWNQPQPYLAAAGLHGDVSRWLGELEVLAVGADNMSWDVIGVRDEIAGCELPGHVELLARRGIYIIENLVLEELAAAQVSRFTFVCTPLKFIGATGSPVRPIAIVPESNS